MELIRMDVWRAAHLGRFFFTSWQCGPVVLPSHFGWSW